jgi:hypothetical protein
MVGGPDMANNRQVLLFSSTVGVSPKPYYTFFFIYKKNFSSHREENSSNEARNDYNEPNKIFASYFAGLFEGDGHI